jgi:hypothetical protein
MLSLILKNNNMNKITKTNQETITITSSEKSFKVLTSKQKDLFYVITESPVSFTLMSSAELMEKFDIELNDLPNSENNYTVTKSEILANPNNYSLGGVVRKKLYNGN